MLNLNITSDGEIKESNLSISISLGTIKASQVVVLNDDSVVVTQRKLM